MRSLEKQPMRWRFSQDAASAFFLVSLLSLFSLSFALPSFGPLHLGHVEVSSTPARLYAAAPAGTTELSITWRFPASARGVALHSDDDLILTLPDAVTSVEHPIECALKWDTTPIPTVQSITKENSDIIVALNIDSATGPWSEAPSDSNAAAEAGSFILLTCKGQYPASYVTARSISPRIVHENNRVTSLQGGLFLPPIRGPFATAPTLSLLPGIAGLPGTLRLSLTLAPDSSFTSLYPLGSKSMLYAIFPDPADWSFTVTEPVCSATVGGTTTSGAVSVLLTKLPAIIFSFTAPVADATGTTPEAVIIDCPNVVAAASTTGYPRRLIEMGIANERFEPIHVVSDAVRSPVLPTPAAGATSTRVVLGELRMGAKSSFTVAVNPLATASSPSAPTAVVLAPPPGYSMPDSTDCQLVIANGDDAEESEEVTVVPWPATPGTAWYFSLPQSVVFTATSSLTLSCPSSLSLASYYNDNHSGSLTLYMTPDAGTSWRPIARAALTFPALTPQIGAIDAEQMVLTFTPAEPVAAAVVALTFQVPVSEAANQANHVIKISLPVSEVMQSNECSISTAAAPSGPFAPVPNSKHSLIASTYTSSTQTAVVSFDLLEQFEFGNRKSGILSLHCTAVRARTIGHLASDRVRYDIFDNSNRILAMATTTTPAVKDGSLNDLPDAISITEDARAGFRSTVSFAVSSENVFLDSTVAVLIDLPSKFDLTLNTGDIACSIEGSQRPVKVLEPTTMLIRLFSDAQRTLGVVVRIVCSLVLPKDPPAATDAEVAFLLFRSPATKDWDTTGLESMLMIGDGAARSFPSYPRLPANARGSEARDYSVSLPYAGTVGGTQMTFKPFSASLAATTEYLTFRLPSGLRVPPNGGRCFFFYDDMAPGDVDGNAIVISRLPASNDRTVRVEPPDTGSYNIATLMSLACDVIVDEQGAPARGDAGFLHFVDRQSATSSPTYYGSGVPALTSAPLGFTAATPAKPLPAEDGSDSEGLAVAVELVQDATGPVDFTYGVRGAALKVTVAHPNIDLAAGDSLTFDLPPHTFRGTAAEIDVGDVTCRWEGTTGSSDPEEPFARVAVPGEDDLFEVTRFTLPLPRAVSRSGSAVVMCTRGSFFLLSSILLVESPTLAMDVRRASTVRPGLLAGEARGLRLKQPVPALAGESLTVKSIETPGGPEGLGDVILTVKALAPVLELPVDSTFIFSVPGRFVTTNEASVKTVCSLYLNELPTTPEPTQQEPNPKPSAEPLMVSTATHKHVGGTSVEEPAETIFTVVVTKPVKSVAITDNYVLTCNNIVYGEREEEDSSRHIELRAASGYHLILTDDGEYSGVTGARLTLYVTHTMTIHRESPLTASQVNAALGAYTSRLKDLTFTTTLVKNVVDRDINTVSFVVALLMTGSTSHDMLSKALRDNRGAIEHDIAAAANARVTTLTLGDVNYPVTCFNGVRDADEADVDCGSTCFACPQKAKCFSDTDCRTGFCHRRLCVGSKPNSAPGTPGATLALVAAALLSVVLLGWTEGM